MIPIKENSVEAVNAIRSFCQATFGVNPELKDTITFLESLIPLQETSVQKSRFVLVKGSSKPPPSEGG